MTEITEGGLTFSFPTGCQASKYGFIVSNLIPSQLDRNWSPGNGAPLPQGEWRLGRGQPWGADWWIGMEPLLPTGRTGIGIHVCGPDSAGCILYGQQGRGA